MGNSGSSEPLKPVIQDPQYVCMDCEKNFTHPGPKLQYPRCRDCEQKGNGALVCSLCRKVFSNQCGFVTKEERALARCTDCGDMMRGHLQQMEYKAIEGGGQQYVYPATLEDFVLENILKSDNNRKGLPRPS